jgi:hypothetical protein
MVSRQNSVSGIGSPTITSLSAASSHMNLEATAICQERLY